MKKRIVYGVVLLLILSFLYSLYLYTRPKNESKLFLTAVSLVKAFTIEEATANELYLGKPLVVSGQVSQILSEEPYSILLDGENGYVQCEFANNLNGISIGDLVSVEGQCTGYLMDVILTKCKIYDENE